ADEVHAHRPDWALADRVHAGDRGTVDDVGRSPRELGDELCIEDVAPAEREVRVLGELAPGERVAVQVVERDDLVVGDEAPPGGRPDEPGAARDEDPLAAQSHSASLTAGNAFPPLAGALHE